MNAKLRCRPGDLALVLRSPDWGKLVTCIETSHIGVFPPRK
jgi:hypothetical protein